MTESNTLKSLIVMYVEDEDDIRKRMSDVLENVFKKLIVARDGSDGLKKFKKFKPDIIVTDVAMPVMDGLEMTREIKAISKNTPVIALSAYSDRDKLLRAINARADKYLIKPIDIEELLNTVKEVALELLEAEDKIDIGKNYQFDVKNRVLVREGEIIRLTKKELQFISLLVKKLGTLVLHEEIKNVVWTDGKVSDAAIRTFIKRIRDKVGHDLVENIPGLGYKIEPNN